MKRLEHFSIWAPSGATWSPWVKPVVFAHLDEGVAGAELPQVSLSGLGPGHAAGATAVVLDLPCEAAVWEGMALAQRGYRPVPLYNACPAPLGIQSVVSASPIAIALAQCSQHLAELALPDDAPPAFLLDAGRRGVRGVKPPEGCFDNRSISLPSDFPSANKLLAEGIKRVVLIQESHSAPQSDLAHTLLRWHEGGLRIEIMPIGAALPVLITVPRPSRFRSLFHTFLSRFGLRRNVLGGFGGEIPDSSSSG